jgi:hypothetical protein
MHELTEEQVLGLLRNLDNHETTVGLGYGGEAAVVISDVPDDEAAELGEHAADVARVLDLVPSLVEVLDPTAYEARALAEVNL